MHSNENGAILESVTYYNYVYIVGFSTKCHIIIDKWRHIILHVLSNFTLQIAIKTKILCKVNVIEIVSK